MRRIIILLSVIFLLMGSAAAPAAADKPTPITFEEVVLGAVNPCTGLTHDVHLTFEGNLHVHKRNEVRTGAFTSGWTTDGYFLDKGREHEKWNVQNNRTVATFHNTWSNSEGSRFRINGQWLIDWDTLEGRFDVKARCLD